MSKGVRALAVVVLGAAGFGGWWFFARPEPAAAAEAAPTFATAEATQGTVRVTVEGPASVSPVRMLTVRAGLNGVLTSAPDVGDRFVAGQIMARFDTTDLEKAVRQAELNLTQAALNRERGVTALEHAQTDLARTERLAESGAVTRDQVDQAAAAVRTAEFALRSADLAVEQATLALESAVTNLDRAVVRAPFTGVVLERTAGAGDQVNSGTALLVLADISRVRVQAEIDEFDIGKVAVGMRVTVSADALGDEPRTSSVERISPAAVVVNNIPIFSVTAVVDNTDGRLRPGMNTDLTINITSERGIVVPSRAVSTVRGRSYVDVMLPDGQTESRRVTIGTDDGMSVVVTEGIGEGELIAMAAAPVFSLLAPAAPVTTGTSIIPINVPGSGSGGGGGSR